MFWQRNCRKQNPGVDWNGWLVLFIQRAPYSIPAILDSTPLLACAMSRLVGGAGNRTFS